MRLMIIHVFSGNVAVEEQERIMRARTCAAEKGKRKRQSKLPGHYRTASHTIAALSEHVGSVKRENIKATGPSTSLAGHCVCTGTEKYLFHFSRH